MTDETYPAATINFYFMFQGGTLHTGSLNLKIEGEEIILPQVICGGSDICFPVSHKTMNRHLRNSQSTVANNTHLIVGEQHDRRGKKFGSIWGSQGPNPQCLL